MFKKRLFKISILVVSVVLLGIYFSNKLIANSADGKLYSDEKQIPFNRVGLLLGTSKFVGGEHHNPYYDYRIDATLKLIKAGKIKYLVISGDNGRKEYNEPALMRSDLINEGVDSAMIYLDYAGFRTFDSIIRLKEIFGQDSVTVISQAFHNERAIYIAGREGISAIGFNATDVENLQGLKTQIREKLARVKVILDFWVGTEPKFLGNKIAIPR